MSSPINYFDLFEIPTQFSVDTPQLKKKFLLLSRKYHPDFFTQEDADAQQEAIEMTSHVNKAWQIFQDPLLTLQYALQLLGAIKEGDNPTLAADFLQEMMEINELLLSNDPEEIKQCSTQLDAIEASLLIEVKNSIENGNAASVKPGELERIKDYYYKKKYIDRLRKRLEQMGH
ncbi:MAG: Fe-S protein assembly co-chaperone HscB [Bacteroidota bacterium]|jgi:molecular chaperone HscB